MQVALVNLVKVILMMLLHKSFLVLK